jgi:polar amino acid transport system substrate-binding protein
MHMTLKKTFSKPRRAGFIAILASAALLTGCVENTETADPASAGSTNAEGAALSGEGGLPENWEEVLPEKNEEIAAMVPADIAEKGTLVIGTNPPFAPAEFKDAEGNIIGFDIDLARAAAAVMGLELEVREQDFALILPNVEGGTIDMGASGFTDNEERRKSFDFVNYFGAGIQWAQQTGKSVNPDDACGLTVAVQRTTVSETEDVTSRSAQCEEEGKEAIKVLAFDTSDEAANAAILGRADAYSADSPVAAWAVERSNGQIELTGEITDVAQYGWAVKKDSELADAAAAALQALIDSGDYEKILDMWGLTDGAVTESKINGQAID